jgi:hypothetical protein
VPATITSSGRVATTWAPGDANNLTGPRRYTEAYKRVRRHHNRLNSARILADAWRHGFVLGGPVVFVRAPKET